MFLYGWDASRDYQESVCQHDNNKKTLVNKANDNIKCNILYFLNVFCHIFAFFWVLIYNVCYENRNFGTLQKNF